MSADLFCEGGALFSIDRVYRYVLWRKWAEGGKGSVNFLMLNPSTADEVENDPTVERCERRARAWGYDGLVVTNLFAFRATDPEAMKAAADPVGPENDQYIQGTAIGAGLVVCAWGVHGAHLGRGAAVREWLARSGVKLHALAVTKDGHPAHPLYLSYDLKPISMEVG